MNPLKYLGTIILILALMSYPVQAGFANTSCGASNTNSTGNVTYNFLVNGSVECNTALDWLNISVTLDTNTTKVWNFSSNNGTMGVHLIINNTNVSSNYSLTVWNGTTGNITHNVTVKSNSTGFILINQTMFGNENVASSGWENLNIINSGGSNVVPSTYIYSAAFAVIVAGGAAIYLRRIRKV